MVEKSELWVDKKGSSKGDNAVEGNKKEKKEVRALSRTLGTGMGQELGGRAAAGLSLCGPSTMSLEEEGQGRSCRVQKHLRALERCSGSLWLFLSPCSMLLMKRSLLKERRAVRTIR